MDSEPPSLDFAAIGHQDSWEKIHGFVNSMRDNKYPRLSMENIRDTYPWIPPRKLFETEIYSTHVPDPARGIYIETFISPDELQASHYRSCLNKIKTASAIACKNAAGIVALGGFTSIVLEGEVGTLSESVSHTTGNTLTAALIIKSIEQVCLSRNVNIGNASLLIVGSTGDIGSALSKYFSKKCKSLILCARNAARIHRQMQDLKGNKASISVTGKLEDTLMRADIIISVASSSDIFSGLKVQRPVIICDAGYPKNLANLNSHRDGLYYHGGMGIVHGGVKFSNSIADSFYSFPIPNVIHGCLLEAIVLSFEKRYESYSLGKGNITTDKIEEIYSLATKHGIDVSPVYNHTGLCL
jgi:fatty aldehyde-generating acyl-ACP reductase